MFVQGLHMVSSQRFWITRPRLPAQALLQFRVEGEEFFFQALEINGVPQNQFIANEFFDLLCSGS